MKTGTAVTIQLMSARFNIVNGIAISTRSSIASGFSFVCAGFCLGLAYATAKL